MNKTQKDFEKAIAIAEKQFIGFQNDFNWNFIKEEETVSNGRYHLVYFTNQMTSTVIKFNSQHGILDVSSVSKNMLNKLIEMQAKLDGTPQ